MTQTLQSINPATNELLQTYDSDSHQTIQKKLKSASNFQLKWKQKTIEERTAALHKLAELLLAQQEELAQLITAEMGKPILQSRNEIAKCAATCAYYATHASRFLKDKTLKTKGAKTYVHLEPLGVVLSIMPWNFPFWQVIRGAAPILAAGNTILLKHASNVSGCALAIEKLIAKATGSANTFRTLLCRSSEVAPLFSAKEIAAVTFTGSTAVGKQIASLAGANLKKHVLELGGSDAYIILKDAPLEIAVQIAVEARLVNSGQSCLAGKRFIVERPILKKFTDLFVEKMKAATYGDPRDEGFDIGPMARKDLRKELHEQVKKSVRKGAKILCGGQIPRGAGAYYPPTVLSNVKKGMPAYEEELFGPVASVIVARDENHALQIANDSCFGLGACLISSDVEKAEQFAAKHLEAGACFVNMQVHSDARFPFGGIKESGYGRELGEEGMKEFCNIKTIFIKA